MFHLAELYSCWGQIKMHSVKTVFLNWQLLFKAKQINYKKLRARLICCFICNRSKWSSVMYDWRSQIIYVVSWMFTRIVTYSRFSLYLWCLHRNPAMFTQASTPFNCNVTSCINKDLLTWVRVAGLASKSFFLTGLWEEILWGFFVACFCNVLNTIFFIFSLINQMDFIITKHLNYGKSK